MQPIIRRIIIDNIPVEASPFFIAGRNYKTTAGNQPGLELGRQAIRKG